MSSVAGKLSKYVIDTNKPEYAHIPKSLEGEVLLEEVKDENGAIKGWITATLGAVNAIVRARDNPTERDTAMKSMTADQFLEATGWKKYFQKWASEGIMV